MIMIISFYDYRVRTRILEQEDAKERERYLIKFIKIMKVGFYK